jgi:glucose/galactose transporter
MTAKTAAPAIQPEPEIRRSQPVAVAIIGMLFFVFGFVTWLNGSLIPFLKIVCGLDNVEAFLVTFAFYIAYTVMALPMAAVLTRIGYRSGMALGLAIMALGALIHIPAAFAASFPLFLVGLFTLGTGLTVLQTASNPYIVLIGPAESAAKRISIMGVVNKAAGIVVPLVFASLVLARIGNVDIYAHHAPTHAVKHMLAARLVLPYLAIAAILLVLVGFVRFAPLPDVTPEPIAAGHDSDRLIDHPRLVLGVLTVFAYMGMEVIAGDTIGLFGQHLGLPNFLSLTSYTMAFMVLGYSLGILLIPRLFSQRTALIGCGVAGLAATMAVLLTSPQSNAVSAALWGWSGMATLPDPVFFVATLGLAHALVWPTVWPLALRGLGDATPRASALLIMAISGGALIPLLFGWLSNAVTDIQHAYLVALPCYSIILFYGWKGCLLERWPGRYASH